jgi:two-component system response regulator HydG
LRYPWPGNVREMENAIERAVIVCRGDTIRPEDLAIAQPDSDGASRVADGHPPVPGSTLAELERYAILRTLEHTGGSTSRAADMLGISPRKIQYKILEYQKQPASTLSPPPPFAEPVAKRPARQ